ncbi:hypothetical protein CS0771_27350 [Catellatospora sp. IY07-71]|uniref:hypothetical protein n=1 Tax=Catellatospora sp. IY07-71 TaxID=2728827 RepID=UPI001BB32452|nr:hypothetical protein [Catellatospora sp. IY07-71]BCJ73191.1 hypothetical protein CS0771_27350 [Catellatospora sp. IY07-71]
MGLSGELRRLPSAARRIAEAAVAAVDAARARDEQGLREAADELAACDPEHVGVVLGSTVRALLEDLHPDGLSGEDVQDVLERCVRDTLAWTAELDVDSLVVVLTGALGVHQQEDGAARPDPRLLAWHAPVLLAYLLTGSGRRFEPYLAAAFAEIARAETVEMP